MNKRFGTWTHAVLMLAFLAGCGGGSDGDVTAATGSGVATIGSSGGVVRGEGAEVSFPAKALATDVTVRVAKDSNGAPPLPPAATAAGAVYLITPHGGALGMHAEVSIPVERAEIGPDEQLLLITAQPGDTQWTVLSGATYSNGAMRAPVMHFSYFQAIVLTGLYMPSLVTTLSNPAAQRFNNIGGPGIGARSADFEYGPSSFLQFQDATLQARLTYPLPTQNVRGLVPNAPPPRACLPSSYGHTGATWRFLRNGSTVAADVRHLPIRTVADDSYPRVEAEIQYARSWFPDLDFFASSPVAGFGALHVYSQDTPRRGDYAPAASADPWALPPPRNSPYDDLLTWSGQILFDPGQHNGRVRIDVAVATDCNLLVEAVPLAFNLNLDSRLPGFETYTGVVGMPYETAVPSGGTAVLPFFEEFEGSSVSIAWEFSTDLVNWQKQPVPARFIRDDGSIPRETSSFGGNSHLYAIVIPNVQPRDAGWYRAWSCSSHVCVGRQPVQLVVQTDPPTVRTQPVAQIVMVGETASFGVWPNGIAGTRDSIGVPLTDHNIRFQWQKQSVVSVVFGGPWLTIAGATGQYFDTPPTVAGDTGFLYRVVLSNSLGSVASNGALLTVVEQLAPPVVQSQPGNSNTVLGGTAVFVVTAGGTAPLSYQWRRNGVNVVGANSPVLSLPNVTAASDGLYDLVVTNRAGSATSNAARLLVTLANPVALPPTIAAAPASITVAAGHAANFAVAVNGTGPYTYLWHKNGSATPIPGADAASFGIASVTVADAGTYTVRVTNTVGTALSAAATLTVTPASGTVTVPTITTPPVALAVLPGAAATFAAAVSGTAPFTYQWRLNGIVIPGATVAVLHLPAVGSFDAGQYVLDVSNAAGSIRSEAVALILIGAPAISAHPAVTAAIEGATARFDVTALGDGLRFLWTRNQVPIAGATSAGYTTSALALGDSGAVYGVIVYNGAGLVVSNGAVLTVTAVTAPPVMTQQPVNLAVNAGTSAAFSLAATAPDTLTLDWQRSNDTGATWTSLSSSGTNYSFVTAAADTGAQFRARVCNVRANLPSNCLFTASAVLTISTAAPSALRPTSMAAGYGNSLVAASDGTVWAWGWQVDPVTGGYKEATPWATRPVQVQGLSSVKAVAQSANAGGAYYALHVDGTVSAWGVNSTGGLGDRTTTTRALPVKVLQDATTPMDEVCTIAAGNSFLLMARATGCSPGMRTVTTGPWIAGFLGNTSIGGSGVYDGAIARAVPGWPAGQRVGYMTAPDAANNGGSAFFITAGGDRYVWGDNVANMLGANGPTFAPGTNGPVLQNSFWSGTSRVELGSVFSVALTDQGGLVAVGRNAEGQLGDGSQTGRLNLLPVLTLANVTDFSAGQMSAVAITAGQLWFWGWNGSAPITRPTRVGTGTGFVTVVVGDIHSLAIGPGGELYSWGDSSYGALGRSGSAATPTVVMRP